MIPAVQEKRENVGVRGNDRLQLLNLFLSPDLFWILLLLRLAWKPSAQVLSKCFLQCKIRPCLLKHFQKKLQTIHLYTDREDCSHNAFCQSLRRKKTKLAECLKITCSVTLWKYIAQKMVRKGKKEKESNQRGHCLDNTSEQGKQAPGERKMWISSPSRHGAIRWTWNTKAV